MPNSLYNAAESALRNPNVRAFLDMISAAEGTTKYGYYTLVGGSRLQSLARHPNITVRLSNTLRSTAAGRYQFLKRTWDDVALKLQLPNFEPHSQDIAAVELIRRRAGLQHILNGDVKMAINAVRREWASFPGAGYGQGERSMSFMLGHYNTALARYGTAPTTTTPQTTPQHTGSSGGAILATALPAAPLPQVLAQGGPNAILGGGLGTIAVLGIGAFLVYYFVFSE